MVTKTNILSTCINKSRQPIDQSWVPKCSALQETQFNYFYIHAIEMHPNFGYKTSDLSDLKLQDINVCQNVPKTTKMG